jgi:hypothetical protein
MPIATIINLNTAGDTIIGPVVLAILHKGFLAVYMDWGGTAEKRFCLLTRSGVVWITSNHVDGVSTAI